MKMTKYIVALMAALAMTGAMANDRGEGWGSLQEPQAKAKSYTAAELAKFKLPADVNRWFIGE